MARDDDNGIGVASLVTFLAHEGATYQFAVDGPRAATPGTSGSPSSWSAAATIPVNDQFAGRTAMPSAPGTANGSNLGATLEPGEPEHSVETLGGSSVWWSWTAPAGGVWRVTTAGSDFDTILAVYSGNGIASLVQLGSDDDEGAGPFQPDRLPPPPEPTVPCRSAGTTGSRARSPSRSARSNIPSTDGIPDSWWDERACLRQSGSPRTNPDNGTARIEEYLADTLPRSAASSCRRRSGRTAAFRSSASKTAPPPHLPVDHARRSRGCLPPGRRWGPRSSCNGALLELPRPPTPPPGGAVYRIEVNAP
ncbi:MAG: hypothetical protein U1F77_03900 [Kiritimatiellia bacterium]